MESLLCDEVWLMSPDNTRQRNDGWNAKPHVVVSTKEDFEEDFGVLLDKETRYLPEPGYLELLMTNHLIRNARFNDVNWLLKSQRKTNLSLGTVFIAVNYLDRFISLTHQCREWKHSMFDLLAIACLSIASKFNETATRSLHQFQVEGLENFPPHQIQLMELRVVKELNWRMDSATPFSYIDLLIQSIGSLNETLVQDLTQRVNELLITALLDDKFLEFRQCVIAISAVKCAFEDLLQSTDNDSLAHLDSILPQDHKDDLIKCESIMGKLLVQEDNILGCGNGPSSPVTVLKDDFDPYPFIINMDLRSGKKRKRKREELECGL